MINLRDHIRIIPDFPKPGINFYDIATLLDQPAAWRQTIDVLCSFIEPLKPDRLMAIEARGFLVASPLALALKCGLGMIRKKGKLPGQVLSYDYDLEYGRDTIQLQPDLIKPGSRVVIIDDLLATGGTMAAAERLCTLAGAQVAGHVCIIELDGLGGRQALKAPLSALLTCPA